MVSSWKKKKLTCYVHSSSKWKSRDSKPNLIPNPVVFYHTLLSSPKYYGVHNCKRKVSQVISGMFTSDGLNIHSKSSYKIDVNYSSDFYLVNITNDVWLTKLNSK